MIYIVICLISLLAFIFAMAKAREMYINGQEEILALNWFMYLTMFVFAATLLTGVFELWHG